MKRYQSTGYLHQGAVILLLCFISSLVAATTVLALTGNHIDQCYDCHGTRAVPGPADTRPNDSTYRNISTGGFVGNHRTHIQTATTATNTCAECHGPAPTVMEHRNGKISFATNINNSRVNGQYNGGVTFVNQTSLPTRYTCTNINCHFETATPQWGQPTASIWSTGKTANDNNANCANCHLTAALATGKHATHITAGGGTQTACAKCHPDYNTLASTAAFSHATTGKGPITVTFAAAPNLGGLYTGGRTGNNFLPGASVAAAGTCSNIYCHSSGNINNAGTTVAPATYKSPAWNATAVGCAACHGDGLAGGKAHPIYASGAPASATANSHVKHVETDAYSCDYCHNSTTSNTTIPPTTVLNGGAHLNKTADVSFKLNGGKTGTYAAAAKNCSATACHGSGIVPWGGTLWSTTDQCGKCHSSTAAGAVTAGTPFYSTAYPGKITINTDAKVGAHTSHITSADSLSAAFACTNCHGTVTLTGATHMNGTTNFTWSTLATKSGALTPSYNPATGVCSNVYCHGASMSGGDTSGTNRTPTWKVAFLSANLSRAACASCHGFPPPTSAGHPAVTIPGTWPAAGDATGALGSTCSCHVNISTTGTTYANIFVDKTKHINGTLEVSGHAVPNYNHQSAGTGAACTGCHTIGANQTYPAVVLGNAPDCMGCHTKAAPGVGCGSCHGDATGKPNSGIVGGGFPDRLGNHEGLDFNGHNSTNCALCHVGLGTQSGSGSGINHGPGNRDTNPNVVGPFLNGANPTIGINKGASPSISCDHSVSNFGGGCGNNAGVNGPW